MIAELRTDELVTYTVHKREVKEGDEVEFELREGRKGMNAVNVSVL